MDILRIHRVKFVKTLQSVPSVLDHLLSDGVITTSNKNEIEYKSNNPDNQVRALLDLLARKGPRSLPGFKNALIETDNEALASLLEVGPLPLPSPNNGTSIEEENLKPPQQKIQDQLYKVLVLQGEDEVDDFKEFDCKIDNCVTIIEQIQKAAGQLQLGNFIVFILETFDGNAVETMSSKKIPISDIYSTLVEAMPDKETFCILKHNPNAKISPDRLGKDPLNSCRLVALSEVRLKELVKVVKESINTDRLIPNITEFINTEEIIWPFGNGYILLLDALEENKEIGDFLHEQHTRMNFIYNIKKCTDIETKLSSCSGIASDVEYFTVFLLGQFNGTEVKDVESGSGFHISKICSTMKEIFPGVPKICILSETCDIETPQKITFDKDNESIEIFSFKKERLTNLIKGLGNSNIPSCIRNFSLPKEKIW